MGYGNRVGRRRPHGRVFNRMMRRVDTGGSEFLTRTEFKRRLKVRVEYPVEDGVHSCISKKHEDNNIVSDPFKVIVDVGNLKSSDEVDSKSR